MARKPLLSTPVLNREDVQSRLAGDDVLRNDVMSRVIENDAAKHGRAATPTLTAAEGQAVEGQEAEIQESEGQGAENLQERKLTRLQESLETRKAESKEVSKGGERAKATEEARAAEETDAQAPRATSREARLMKAMEVAAEDEMIVVSVRVPAKLNDYIDQYVARVAKANPKRRYRKQDAMAAALAGFIADHPMPAGSVEEQF